MLRQKIFIFIFGGIIGAFLFFLFNIKTKSKDEIIGFKIKGLPVERDEELNKVDSAVVRPIFFLNNPYLLKNTDSIYIYIRSQCIHKSTFRLSDSLKIAQKFLNKRIMPKVIVKTDNTYYMFTYKDQNLLDLKEEDKFLVAYFAPQNDKYNSFFIFSR